MVSTAKDVSVELVKVAMIRRPDGSLYFNCPCGAQPARPSVEAMQRAILKTDTHTKCGCGRTFTATGWVVTP